jgi:hypothetical protein
VAANLLNHRGTLHIHRATIFPASSGKFHALKRATIQVHRDTIAAVVKFVHSSPNYAKLIFYES